MSSSSGRLAAASLLTAANGVRARAIIGCRSLGSSLSLVGSRFATGVHSQSQAIGFAASSSFSSSSAAYQSSSSSTSAAPETSGSPRQRGERGKGPRGKSAPSAAAGERGPQRGKDRRRTQSSRPGGKSDYHERAEKKAEEKRQAFSARSALEAKAAGYQLAGVETVAAFRARFEELSRGGESFGLFSRDISVPLDRLCKLLLAEGSHLSADSEATLNRVLDALVLALDRRRWWTVAEARSKAAERKGAEGEGETAAGGVSAGDLAHSFFGPDGTASTSASSSASASTSNPAAAAVDVSATTTMAQEGESDLQPAKLSAEELATSASNAAAAPVTAPELPHRPHWRSMYRSSELASLAHVLASHKLASSEHLDLISQRLLDFGLFRNIPAAEAASLLSAFASAQADGVVLSPNARKLASSLLPLLSERLSSMEAPQLCDVAFSLHSLRKTHANISRALFIQVGDLLAAKLKRSTAIQPSPRQMAAALEAFGCAGLRSTRLVAAAAKPHHSAFPRFQTEFWLSEGVSNAALAADAETLCELAHSASRFGLLAPRKLQEDKMAVPGSGSTNAGGKGKAATAVNHKTGKKKFEVETRSAPIDAAAALSKHGLAGDAVWEAIERRASELLAFLNERQVLSLAASFAKASRVKLLEESSKRLVSTTAGKLVASSRKAVSSVAVAGAGGDASSASPAVAAAQAEEGAAQEQAQEGEASEGAAAASPVSPMAMAVGSPLFWAAMKDSLLPHTKKLGVSDAALAAWSFSRVKAADEGLLYALSMRVIECLHPDTRAAAHAEKTARKAERRKEKKQQQQQQQQEQQEQQGAAEGAVHADASASIPASSTPSSSSSSSSFHRLGQLKRAHSHAEAACLLLPALEGLVAPGTTGASPLFHSPYAEAFSLLLSDTAKSLFESLPQQHQSQQNLAGAAPAASFTASNDLFAQQFIEACEPVADLLRMSMLATGVMKSRTGASAAAAAKKKSGRDRGSAEQTQSQSQHSALFFHQPLRQLAVASALAIGTHSDEALLSGYSVDRLMSLLACYSVAEVKWAQLASSSSEGSDAVKADGSPERVILSGAASRLRKVLVSKGLSMHAQVAALRELREVFFTQELAETVLRPAVPFGSMPSNPLLAYRLPQPRPQHQRSSEGGNAMSAAATAAAIAVEAAKEAARRSRAAEMKGGGIR